MTAVLANPGCQYDYIWNQLRPKQWDMTVRDFLDWIFEVQSSILNLAHTF